MRATQSRLAALSLAFVGATLVDAQTQSFQWGWLAGPTPALPECASVKLTVFNQTLANNAPAQPPYYMMAYPPNGIASSQLIGSDANNLTWQVQYASGTQLLLQIADANGNSGGIPGTLYTVSSGVTAACHSNSNASPVVIATTTRSLNTCDPLTVNFTGGIKPYTITIVAQNGLHVTNVTMGPQDDQYTYIDRANPADGTGLLVAASDSTGRYAVSTPLITIGGSSDATCPGKESTSGRQGSSSSSRSVPSPTGSPNGGKHVSSALIGGAVAGGVVVLMALIGLLVMFMRRKSKRDQQEDSQSARPNSKLTEGYQSWPSTPGMGMPPQQYAVHPSMMQYNDPRMSVNQYTHTNQGDVALGYSQFGQLPPGAPAHFQNPQGYQYEPLHNLPPHVQQQNSGLMPGDPRVSGYASTGSISSGRTAHTGPYGSFTAPGQPTAGQSDTASYYPGGQAGASEDAHMRHPQPPVSPQRYPADVKRPRIDMGSQDAEIPPAYDRTQQ